MAQILEAGLNNRAIRQNRVLRQSLWDLIKELIVDIRSSQVFKVIAQEALQRNTHLENNGGGSHSNGLYEQVDAAA